MMLVIRSKDINKQLEEGMMEYEKVSRQILEGGTYNDPSLCAEKIHARQDVP